MYFSEYEGEEISGKDFKKRIVSIAIEKFIDKMYDDYMNDRVYSTIKDDAKEIVKSHSKEIIDSVIDRVTNEVIKKRIIANEMPKKSEITNINKEWEEYFVRLIDKAIANVEDLIYEYENTSIQKVNALNQSSIVPVI